MLARVKAIHWAKDKKLILKVADHLGRGKGRLRLFDLKPSRQPHLKIDLSRWDEYTFAAAWIGHATVLLRLGNKTILTDPVFSNKIGIGLGFMTAGPRRLVAPAVTIKQLPKIDLVLLSHAHFDHLDRPTLNRLPKNITICTAPNTSELIIDLGFKNVKELQWHETFVYEDIKITAMPCRHWGARTISDKHRGYNAYLIQNANKRIYFGGDSAFHDEVPQGPIDLAILGIGAYEPWIHAHASPEQAFAMAGKMKARNILPIHHSTFKLSGEPLNEPVQRLLKAAAVSGSESRIAITEIGRLWTD